MTPPRELLETCISLARDMLSCDPETVRGYKRAIDGGFEGTYAEGLRLEVRSSAEHARRVGADAIAKRREAVQQRGRAQAGG